MNYTQSISTSFNFPITRKIYPDKYIPQRNDSLLKTIQKISILIFTIIGFFTLIGDLYTNYRKGDRKCVNISHLAQHNLSATNPAVLSSGRLSHRITRPKSNFWGNGKKVAAVVIGVLGIAAIGYMTYQGWIKPTSQIQTEQSYALVKYTQSSTFKRLQLPDLPHCSTRERPLQIIKSDIPPVIRKSVYAASDSHGLCVCVSHSTYSWLNHRSLKYLLTFLGVDAAFILGSCHIISVNLDRMSLKGFDY
jgi:hypothetical protein